MIALDMEIGMRTTGYTLNFERSLNPLYLLQWLIDRRYDNRCQRDMGPLPLALTPSL